MNRYQLLRSNISQAGIVLFFMLYNINQTAASEVIVIRCTSYEVPIFMFPSSQVLGFRVKEDPFDIYIVPSEKIGWFNRILPPFLTRNRPASLEISEIEYRISTSTEEYSRGDKYVTNEWITIDRISGEMNHYTQSPNRPGEAADVHKRGGDCKKVERKF